MKQVSIGFWNTDCSAGQEKPLMVDAIASLCRIKFLDIILLAESSGLDFSILIREINKQAEKDFCFPKLPTGRIAILYSPDTVRFHHHHNEDRYSISSVEIQAPDNPEMREKFLLVSCHLKSGAEIGYNDEMADVAIRDLA